MEPLELTGLRPPTRVNAPVRTEGSQPREGGIVLEPSLAEALGLQVGTTLRFAAPGRPIELPVIGTAISPSQPRYPRSSPGVGWVTRATFARIVPDRDRWNWTQAIRLRDPSTAPALADRAAASMTSWAEDFIGTPQMRRGTCPTSRKCSMTMLSYRVFIFTITR